MSARSFKPYPVYKDSGVEWMGEIPAHWEVKRLKHLTGFSTGWTPPTGREDLYGGDHLWANISDLGQRVITTTEKTITDSAIREARLRIVRSGSLLFSFKLSVGTVSIAGADMYTNEAIAAFSPSTLIDTQYLYWAAPLLVPRNAQDNIYGAPLLSRERISNASLVSPPKPEQRAIATFLDRETARIDRLVSKKERLIELLLEQRTALITRAVTRGLDLNVPMKESGVEWLGQIPAHWEHGKLRRFWTVVDCKHRTALYVDQGFPIVSTTEVKPGRLKLDGPRRVAEADFNDLTRDGRNPRRGDIIYSRNASLGSAAYVDSDEPFCMGQDVCLITSRADQLYLTYQLNSPIVLGQIEEISVGSTFERINVAQIKSFQVARPPENEQRAIAAFLDRETARIDALVAKIQKATERLKELRTAVISAAVTGKIDLRGEIA
jgi:type I restriction enzyme S subunit